MDGWAIFWGLVLLISFCMFAVLAVAVTIGGFRDMLALFRGIDARHEQQAAAGVSEDDED